MVRHAAWLAVFMPYLARLTKAGGQELAHVLSVLGGAHSRLSCVSDRYDKLESVREPRPLRFIWSQASHPKLDQVERRFWLLAPWVRF